MCKLLERFFDVVAEVLLDEMQYLRVTLMISLEAVHNNDIRAVLARQGIKAQEILGVVVGRYIEARGIPDAPVFTSRVMSMVSALARGGIVDLPFSAKRFRATLADCVTVIKALADERLSRTVASPI